MSNRRTINRRNRNRGKAHERNIAKLLGGLRMGTMGAVDVHTDWAAIECKSTSSMPAYLRAYHEQAMRHAKEGQIPLVAIHEKNKPYTKDFVMIRMDHFLEWLNDLGVLEQIEAPIEKIHA